MKNPFASKAISEATRRRLELATAVAQERLLAVHVEHALELIQIGGDEIPFDTALDIYARMLRLGDDESRIVATRALARLGEQAAATDDWPELLADDDAADAELPRRRRFGVQLRQRLRGRVRDELRRSLELAAARAEVRILETHVHNSLRFVAILEHEIPFDEAVALYLDTLDVRDSVAEVAYYMALERLAAERFRYPRADESLPLSDSLDRPLRLIRRGDG